MFLTIALCLFDLVQIILCDTLFLWFQVKFSLFYLWHHVKSKSNKKCILKIVTLLTEHGIVNKKFWEREVHDLKLPTFLMVKIAKFKLCKLFDALISSSLQFAVLSFNILRCLCFHKLIGFVASLLWWSKRCSLSRCCQLIWNYFMWNVTVEL